MLFEKWRHGFEILVQKPGYSVLAIEKNCKVHLYPQHAYLKCIKIYKIFYIKIYEIFCIKIYEIFNIFLKKMLINICLVELLRQGTYNCIIQY